jgi:hypothetical protein
MTCIILIGNLQSPQPNGAWLRRAILDEVCDPALTPTSELIRGTECPVFYTRYVLVLFETGCPCVSGVRHLLRCLIDAYCSCTRSIYDFLLVPCLDVRTHHSLAPNSTSWSAYYRRRASSATPISENASGLGQK